MHGHVSDSMTCGHPGLNLKVGKMNHCLGNLDPESVTGQYVPKVDKTFLEVGILGE